MGLRCGHIFKWFTPLAANILGRPHKDDKPATATLPNTSCIQTRKHTDSKTAKPSNTGLQPNQIAWWIIFASATASVVALALASFLANSASIYFMTFNAYVVRSIPASASCASVEFRSVFIDADTALAKIIARYIFFNILLSSVTMPT